MKLFWMPGSCSLAVHIALREAGASFDMQRVDLATMRLADGRDYLEVNPRGALPALELDDGTVLTETAVLLQYVAHTLGKDELVPKELELPRFRVLEWLNFLAAEVHKGFSVMFNPQAPDDFKQQVHARLDRHFKEMNDVLSAGDWLANGRYSVADIYAFVISNWAAVVGIDLSEFTALETFRSRVAGRPAVQAALKAEGLV